MNLLFLNPAGSPGGAERALLDVMASLAAARPGWRLGLIAAADGEFVAEARALGVDAAVMKFPRAISLLGDAAAGGPAGDHRHPLAVAGRVAIAAPAIARYTRALRRAIAQRAPDAIHTNGFKMHVLGAWAAPRATPLIWHLHDYVRARPMMSRLLQAHAGRAAAIVANSHSVAADARRLFGRRAGVIAVHNAVDLERFSPAGPMLDLDRLAGLPPLGEGGVRVGLVATLARWKGHRTFLRALAGLPAHSPVRGYVIGGALYETAGSQHALEDLRGYAGALGLDSRVGFTGFAADAPAALRALDIVVHASTEPEPFGLVIAEAMACGKAVIASVAGGAAELFIDGAEALGHRPGDAAELAGAIARLAADRALRLRLGAAAADAARRRFTRERLASELIPIYERATGEKRARPAA